MLRGEWRHCPMRSWRTTKDNKNSFDTRTTRNISPGHHAGLLFFQKVHFSSRQQKFLLTFRPLYWGLLQNKTTRAETNPNISGTNPFRILQTNIGYPRILWPFSQTLLNTLFLSLEAISFVMMSSAKVCTMYVLNFLFFSFLLHAASL